MKNELSINEFKNKFRGIISVFRSKSFKKDKRISDSAILRQGIKKLYLDCRSQAPDSNFSEIFSWLHKSIRTQIPEYNTSPIGYEDLRIINSGVETAPLSSEINWITVRLSFESKNINKFLNYKRIIEEETIKGNYQSALDFLSKKEKELGASLWSIQLKISLLQSLKGLEAQKQYTAEIRNVWPGGVLSYIAYFTSVRNEERTSLVKFIDDMNIKLNKQKIDEKLIDHLKFHLTGKLPKTEEGLASLLETEQLGTTYDLYESIISIVLSSVINNCNIANRVEILNCISSLSNINDARLVKAKFHLTNNSQQLQLSKRDTSLSDNIISNEHERVRKVLRSIRSNYSLGIDVWDYIYLGVWLGSGNRKYKGKRNLPHNLHRLIGNALSEGNMANDINTLLKLSVNYSGLSIFNAINEFLNFLTRNEVEHADVWSLHFIGLHSRLIGIEDFKLGDTLGSNLVSETVTSRLWQFKSLPAKTNDLPILKGFYFLSNQDIEGCLRVLPGKITDCIPQPYRLLYTHMKLFSLSKEGHRSDIINLINEVVPYSNDIIDIVAFEEILNDFEYENFESTDNLLNASIALFIAWLKTEDSKLLSYLRIATKKAIKSSGSKKPSELHVLSENQNKNQLIFFLNYICVPQIIDGIRALQGSKAVLNERQDICRLLIDLDPKYTADYQTEINSISDELLMEAGQRVVDRTRIYVDMDAHTRWIFKELREDYERYKDLLDIRISGVQNYQEIIDDYLKADNATKTTFIPDNEADAVLLGVVARASNDFLTNPKYGLDYYLSKRIRHQSFIGLIRSHLEFSELITTRVSEDKEFEYNHYWVNKFKSLNQCKKDQLNGLLAQFAKEFDDELIHVRDNVFQLNTEECPTGLIKIDFNVQVMSLLKHFIIETNASFDEFVYYLNTFMWAFLQPSLDKTKKYIKEKLKPSIMHSADKLKANARKLAVNDNAFYDFELTLTDQTAAVQRSLEDVTSWFTPLTDVTADRVVLSVDKVLSLSIRAALDMLKPFEPNINSTIDNKNDIMLHQNELTFVNDTIFILLDNIKTHSGIKRPKVEIKILVDMNNETITIFSSNEIKASDHERLSNEITKIQELIKDGKLGNRAKVEGRSGFIKLAASIDKADKGHLNFNLDKNNKFTLSITNDLQVEQVPLEHLEVENV